MKMTKIAAMLSLLLTGAVLADQLPFYSITEMAAEADRGSANFGPWALSISNEMLDLAVENDMLIISSAFSMFKCAGILYSAGLKPIY